MAGFTGEQDERYIANEKIIMRNDKKQCCFA
jgi:hypothetical protein